jgi:CHAD domain-containing protein
MAPRLPPNLLDRSAPESARLLALSHLDGIDKTAARLADPRDPEALHDFRVGLRRLRSTLKAYKVQLEDSVTPKMRRQVGKLARATNEGRDVEVQLEWLGKQLERLGPDEVAGFYWLVGRLEHLKQESREQVNTGVARKYGKTAAKLRRALGVLRIELETGQGHVPPTFREVTGTLAREHVIQLRQEFGAIQGPSDFEQAHRARISMKRLRYLLEPIARRNRRAGALVRLFKEGQDLLGEHHDMHILSGTVASFRNGLAASSFAGVEAGLATLARLAEESAASAFERFQALWGEDMAAWILTRADELGQSLEAGPHGAPPAPAPRSSSGDGTTVVAPPAGNGGRIVTSAEQSLMKSF